MSDTPKLATEDQVKSVADTFTELYNHQGKQIKSIESGIIDSIIPSSPAPTKRGQYVVSAVGVYTNFKDSNNQSISVTEEEFTSGVVYLIYNGTNSRKVVVPIEANGEIKEGDIRPISGDKVNKNNKAFFSQSPNLLDFSKVKSGIWERGANNIMKNTHRDNYICVEIDNVNENKEYYLQGISEEMPNTTYVVSYTNQNYELISRINGLEEYHKLKTPLGTKKILVVISSDTGIGLNPTDNKYKYTAMLSEGSVLKEFSEYGLLVDSNKIVGLNESISNSEVVKDNTNKIDFLMSDYKKYFLFDGTSQKVFSEDFVIKNDGDYIEAFVKINKDYSGYKDGLGFLGKGQRTDNVIGFGTINELWMKGKDTDPYIKFNIPTNTFNFFKLRIEVKENNIVVYINDEIVGSKPFVSELRINNLGNAYTSKAKFGITYLKINNLAINILENSENIITEYYTENNEINTVSSGDLFFEYKKNMYKNNDGCIVYVNVGGDYYIGFGVYKFLDLSEIIYSDYYRIMDSFLYKYEDEKMINQNIQALIGSENEFTMLQKGKSDHTGGYHGDEKLIYRRFIANGVEIDYNQDIELTEIKSFFYDQLSNLHETSSSDNPDIHIENHPIIAEHYKKTTFTNGGYVTKNSITYKQAIEVIRIYTGLVCVSKNFATTGVNEYGAKQTIKDGTNGDKLRSKNGNEITFSGDHGGCLVSSKVLDISKPNNSGIQNEQLYRNSCDNWVADRLNDSKYYRVLGSRGSSTSLVSDIGEQWSVECVVRFTKK
ncbi:hypothetical protein [Myroides fluvii]|uniref:hypothetical protein n=1 Tax=Myroides fluvii TaxID=2572594 RepID=UPI00131EBBF6|nr:hypothetical protein [Myroides fluvii]